LLVKLIHLSRKWLGGWTVGAKKKRSWLTLPPQSLGGHLCTWSSLPIPTHPQPSAIRNGTAAIWFAAKSVESKRRNLGHPGSLDGEENWDVNYEVGLP
jgi:hypothetical protein